MSAWPHIAHARSSTSPSRPEVYHFPGSSRGSAISRSRSRSDFLRSQGSSQRPTSLALRRKLALEGRFHFRTASVNRAVCLHGLLALGAAVGFWGSFHAFSGQWIG